jgi:hypothetical protein
MLRDTNYVYYSSGWKYLSSTGDPDVWALDSGLIHSIKYIIGNCA